MPQGYYTIEQWTRGKKGSPGAWVEILHLPFGPSLSNAETAVKIWVRRGCTESYKCSVWSGLNKKGTICGCANHMRRLRVSMRFGRCSSARRGVTRLRRLRKLAGGKSSARSDFQARRISRWQDIAKLNLHPIIIYEIAIAVGGMEFRHFRLGE
jgi:hypothetical protein